MFPQAPGTNGNWFAIYMEPVIGCGERITIAVAAVTSGNRSKVVQAIHSDVLECIYGSQAYKLQSQVNWVIDSASKHLEINQCLSSWKSPLSGIHVGEKRRCEAHNIEGMLRQAIEFSASLNNLTISKENKSSSPNETLGHFAKNVRDKVLEKQPLLSSYFNREAEVLQDNRVKTKFGFLNNRYAANLVAIRATSLANNVNTAKAKILELQALKSTLAGSDICTYELILGVPEESLSISEVAFEKIHTQAKFLQELADQQTIEVVSAGSIDQAASHLLDMAA